MCSPSPLKVLGLNPVQEQLNNVHDHQCCLLLDLSLLGGHVVSGKVLAFSTEGPGFKPG